MRKILLSVLFSAMICLGVSATSPLATGRWAKVSVDTTGIFEISYEALRQAGFPKPEAVAVYGSGGIVASDNSFSGPYGDGFAPAPCLHTSDGRLLFFAEGAVRGNVNASLKLDRTISHYDTRAYYYLTDKNGAPAALSEGGEAAVTAENAAVRHYSAGYCERQSISPASGGAIMLSKRLQKGSSDTYRFALPGYDPEGGEAVLYAEYGQKTDDNTKIDVSLSDNASLKSTKRNDAAKSTNDVEVYKRGDIMLKFVPEATDVTADFTFDVPAGNRFAAVDFAYVVYPRTNSMVGIPQLLMQYEKSPETIEIHDAPADLVVWNISPAGDFDSRRLTHDADNVYLDGTGCRRLIAFSPSARHRAAGTPESVANTALADSDTPDILIICGRGMAEAAEELADIHRQYQKSDVLVAMQDAVFDEFSEGSRTPMAFRRLAKKLYDRRPGKLRNIILYGTGSYNNLLLDNKGSMLITYQNEDTWYSRYATTCYCADQYFGMLSADYRHNNDFRGEMLVNVGRIAASSAAEGKTYNAKVRRFFEEGPKPEAFVRLALYSGTGDNYQHFNQTQEAADSLAANPLLSQARFDSYFYIRQNNDESYKDRITEDAARTFSLGAGMMLYAGHSTPGTMDHIIDDRTITAYKCTPPPLGVFASCEIWDFDRKGSKSCNDRILLREHGGTIGSIASGRTVFLQYNRTLTTAVARVYATLKPGATYGDIMRLARKEVMRKTTVSDVLRNTMSYGYAGDPALPVPVPALSIRLDNSGVTEFVPLKGSSVSGAVTDAGGNIAEDFNGTVRLYLHAPSQAKTNVVDTEKVLKANDEHEILAVAVARAERGRFTANITVPRTGMASTGNRMTVTAVSDDKSVCAAGFSHDFAIAADAAGEAPDNAAPSITAAYIDSEDFVNGDIVPGSFTYHAVIDPSPSGLRIAPGIERSVKLDLDGKSTVAQAAALVRLAPDGTAHLDVPFADLTTGKHTITLTVANNAGLQACAKTDFTIASGGLDGTLTADYGDDSAARENIDFTLDGSEAGESRIIVTDSMGRTVLSRTVSFPYTWNLTGTDGMRVPDGSYRAWAVLRDGKRLGSTPAVHFTVLRPRQGNK